MPHHSRLISGQRGPRRRAVLALTFGTALLGASFDARGVTATWDNDGAGTSATGNRGKWGTGGQRPNNWNPNGSVPRLAGDKAVFTTTSAMTIALELSPSLGTMEFNSSTSYGFTPGGFSFTFDNNGSVATLSTLVTNTAAHTIAPNVALNDDLLVSVAGGTISITGVVSGAQNLEKSATGTLSLAGTAANTYSGTTTVTAGVLRLEKTAGVNAIAGNLTIGNNSGALDIVRLHASNQIADSSVVTLVGSGATAGVFSVNTFSETVGGISSASGAGIIENGGATASTLTVSNAANQSYGGIIRNGSSGAFALTKSGAARQTLTGANTYTGATIINGGILAVDGTHTGAGNYNVNTGGTLGGGGVITPAANNSVTINGTVAPGTGVGSLTLTTSGTGRTILPEDGVYNVEIGAQSGTPGIHWDLVKLTGVNVTAGTTAGTKFVIKIISLSNPTTQGPIPGWNSNAYSRFTIATFTSGITLATLDQFELDTSAFPNATDGGYFLELSGNNLDFVSVPEPGSLTLLGVAGAAMLRRRARRPRRA